MPLPHQQPGTALHTDAGLCANVAHLLDGQRTTLQVAVSRDDDDDGLHELREKDQRAGASVSADGRRGGGYGGHKGILCTIQGEICGAVLPGGTDPHRGHKKKAGTETGFFNPTSF